MSLRQIASNLGLSITTVSRALGGYSDVSDATRQRIEAEAARIGYVPNEMARRLQKGQADAIGFVIPGGPEAFDDPYFLQIISGAWARAEEHDLDLLVMTSPPGAGELKLYRRLVEGRRVDGLIVTRMRQDDQRLSYLLRTGMPFVALGAGHQVPAGVACIDADNRAAMRAILSRLTANGHRRIVCAGPDYLGFSRYRMALFAELAPEFGVTAELLVDELAMDAGERILERLLTEFPLVTALVTTGDRMSAGAVRGLRARGLQPGRDLSVIGFGDSPLARVSDPPITSVQLPTAKMASQAIDTLLRLRDGYPVEPLSLWPAKLVGRESDGVAPIRSGRARELLDRRGLALSLGDR